MGNNLTFLGKTGDRFLDLDHFWPKMSTFWKIYIFDWGGMTGGGGFVPLLVKNTIWGQTSQYGENQHQQIYYVLSATAPKRTLPCHQYGPIQKFETGAILASILCIF